MTVSCSSRTSQLVFILTTGTSSENGAPTPAGWVRGLHRTHPGMSVPAVLRPPPSTLAQTGGRALSAPYPLSSEQR